jgi:hypothetical protein
MIDLTLHATSIADETHKTLLNVSAQGKASVEDSALLAAIQALQLKSAVNAVLPMPQKNKEESYTFPIGTKSISIWSRSGNKIAYAFSAGIINQGTSKNVPEFTEYAKNGLYLDAPLTIYFMAPVDDETLEIEYWL